MEALVVLGKITTLFLLITAGWYARRRGYVGPEATGTLGRLVVDLCLPALVFVQMVSTVDRHTWREDWIALAVGAGVMLLALATGWISARGSTRPASRATFAFLVGTPNWIYLPLPIAHALYGDPGVRAVLLGNISAQLILWTLGVATLRGKTMNRASVWNAVGNPGVLAALAGIVLAIAFPAVGGWARQGAVAPSWSFAFAAGIGFDALGMLGSVTVPLSLILIGAQLGGPSDGIRLPQRDVALLVASRLVLGPAVVIGLAAALAATGVHIPDVPRRVGFLIATMPVAVSCTVFTERFGGDVPLSARAITVSTLASIATVPIVFQLVRWLVL